MKAAVVTGPYRLEVQKVAEPVITKETEIKIRVISGAICNMTDNKVYATEKPEKEWPYMKFPFIIGHESSGYLVDKGSNIRDFDTGDRIVYWGVGGKAFADYLIIETSECAVGKINENVSDDMAAIMEMIIGSSRFLFSPKGDCYIKKGDRVVIFGAGPAGLIFSRITRLLGASMVVIGDMIDFRLNKAMELGVDKVFNAKDPRSLEMIKSELGGSPDVIIDATGADIVGTIVKLGQPGTMLVPFGVPPFNWNDRLKQLTEAGIVPCFEGADSARYAIRYCIDWANRGILGLEPIITHHLPIEQAGYGLDLCRDYTDRTLKVVIEINKRW